MVTKENSITQFVKQQIKRWESAPAEKDRRPEDRIPVITVSMKPGGGGSLVAREVADRLGFDYFHRGIIEGIAKSAKIRASVIDTLEKERLPVSLSRNLHAAPGKGCQHDCRSWARGNCRPGRQFYSSA
jgi:hypothetical protein